MKWFKTREKRPDDESVMPKLAVQLKEDGEIYFASYADNYDRFIVHLPSCSPVKHPNDVFCWAEVEQPSFNT